MKPGDLIYVRGSNLIRGSTPLIITEKYHDGNSLYYQVLDPGTGHRYHYQEHNLSEFPT